jgi:transposase
MTDAAIIAAMRSETPDDTELTESLKVNGWVAHFPAIQDEHGVTLVGNRRLRIAKQLGIKPVIVTLTIGVGESADAERLKLALVSNIGGKPISRKERQTLAIYLFQKRGWTEQRIADGIGRSRTQVVRYLDGISPEGTNSPERTEKRGRPKGRKPKPHKYDETVEKKAAELFLDEGKSVAQVAKELGVSEQVVIRSSEREIGRRDPLIDPSTLSMTAQEKLAAALRQHQKQLDLRFEERVQAERLRRDQIWLEHELKEFTEASLRNQRFKAHLKPGEYRNLLRCLHTDTLAGIRERARRGDPPDEDINRLYDSMFNLITGLKALLTKEERAVNGPTLSELDRRREEVRAKARANAAKGQATKAAKAAVRAAR